MQKLLPHLQRRRLRLREAQGHAQEHTAGEGAGRGDSAGSRVWGCRTGPPAALSSTLLPHHVPPPHSVLLPASGSLFPLQEAGPQPVLTTLLLSGCKPLVASPVKVQTVQTGSQQQRVRGWPKSRPALRCHPRLALSFSQQLCEAGAIITPILQARSTRPGGATCLRVAQPGFKSRQPRRFSTVSAWQSSPDRRPPAFSWAPGPGGHYPCPALPRCPSLASSAHRCPIARSGVSQAPFMRPRCAVQVRAQRDRASSVSASPQRPLLVTANAAPGPPAQARPHRPRNPLGLQRPFLPASSKHFPICDLPGQGPASGVWEGSAFLCPLYRDRPRPGDIRGEPQRAAADPEKSSLLQPSQLQMNKLRPRGEQAYPSDTWARALGS